MIVCLSKLGLHQRGNLNYAEDPQTLFQRQKSGVLLAITTAQVSKKSTEGSLQIALHLNIR